MNLIKDEYPLLFIIFLNDEKPNPIIILKSGPAIEPDSPISP